MRIFLDGDDRWKMGEHEIDIEDLEAAASMYDQLVDSSFYKNQEKSAQEMGMTLHYLPTKGETP